MTTGDKSNGGVLLRSAFEKLIPHSDDMCLLDEVISWNKQKIHCLSNTHLDIHNPMRADNTLSAICAIEYAAQAMAIHGGLTAMAGKRPKAGYLASVRDIHCTRLRIDDLAGEMNIYAEQIMGDEMRVIYQFNLTIDALEIISGRATVVLDIEGLNI